MAAEWTYKGDGQLDVEKHIEAAELGEARGWNPSLLCKDGIHVFIANGRMVFVCNDLQACQNQSALQSIQPWEFRCT